MSWRWRVKRLSAMGPREIAYRVQQHLRALAERRGLGANTGWVVLSDHGEAP